MHPEILRELGAQRGREMRARARQARLAQMAIRSRRGRHLPDETGFTMPAIPDYVDGSFRAEPVHTELAGEQAPAARHAA